MTSYKVLGEAICLCFVVGSNRTCLFDILKPHQRSLNVATQHTHNTCLLWTVFIPHYQLCLVHNELFKVSVTLNVLMVQKCVTSQKCFIHFLFVGCICVGLLGVECWLLFLVAWVSNKCRSMFCTTSVVAHDVVVFVFISHFCPRLFTHPCSGLNNAAGLNIIPRFQF